MPKKTSHRKKGTWYLFRYIVAVTVAVLFFAVVTTVTNSINKPSPCANSRSCVSDLTEKIETNVTGFFGGRKVIPPAVNLAEGKTNPVLGAETSPGEKHIYVDLSTQTLTAYQGNTQVIKTYVSTGKWGKTPVGNFNIWEKLRSTRMAGGEGDDAYDLPNVQYVMYFYHDFGLHQAYWHDNFGHPMSHGCVNLRLVDAKALYEWADGPDGSTKGTAVSVCNEISNNGQCIQNNPVQ